MFDWLLTPTQNSHSTYLDQLNISKQPRTKKESCRFKLWGCYGNFNNFRGSLNMQICVPFSIPILYSIVSICFNKYVKVSEIIIFLKINSNVMVSTVDYSS